MSSSVYEPVAERRRRPRKERFRKPYIPSTIGSASESSMSIELGRVCEVQLSLQKMPLGIQVASYEGHIYVSQVYPGSAAALDGRLEPGDQILQVNSHSFQNLSVDGAVSVIKEAAMSKRTITLYFMKNPKMNDYDPLASLASETMPLDISLWVQTQRCVTERQQKQPEYFEDTTHTFDEGTLDLPGETDDEEERALYDQRRNGIPHRLIEDAQRRIENEQNEHQVMDRLTTNMDPYIIVRNLAKPDSGLPIENRKWLKISVPSSFIGRDLVTWLLEHVENLRDRKDAKAFAAKLLEGKYIGHVVNKVTFSERCYYVLGERMQGLRAGADNVVGTLRAEATTEVTYVGSPAPRGFRHTRNPLQTIAPIADQTWPISPITVVDKSARGYRRKDCESPVTNDYASMVGVESTTSYGRGISRDPNFHQPPPNTPLGSTMTNNMSHRSPCETEFEDDDRRILTKY